MYVYMVCLAESVCVYVCVRDTRCELAHGSFVGLAVHAAAAAGACECVTAVNRFNEMRSNGARRARVDGFVCGLRAVSVRMQVYRCGN